MDLSSLYLRCMSSLCLSTSTYTLLILLRFVTSGQDKRMGHRSQCNRDPKFIKFFIDYHYPLTKRLRKIRIGWFNGATKTCWVARNELALLTHEGDRDMVKNWQGDPVQGWLYWQAFGPQLRWHKKTWNLWRSW